MYFFLAKNNIRTEQTFIIYNFTVPPAVTALTNSTSGTEFSLNWFSTYKCGQTDRLTDGDRHKIECSEFLPYNLLGGCHILHNNGYKRRVFLFHYNITLGGGGCSKSLLAPKAAEASMGTFYFQERVNGCCNGACGYCYAIGVQHTEVPNQGASW